MEIIVITPPTPLQAPPETANALFEAGLQRLHLRFPDTDRKHTAQWIEQIAQPYRQRIVIHDHHDLAGTMALGGIHLNSRNPQPPHWYDPATGITLSRSCHTIDELKQYARQYDYLFLSPIFDSISKQGYTSAFTAAQLRPIRQFLSRNIYALGGITAERLPLIQQLGFKGAAILGDLWQQPDTQAILQRFRNYSKIQEKTKALILQGNN